MIETSPLVYSAGVPCRELLQQRANLYSQVRQFFKERAVLEVETPIFSQSGNTDPFITPIVADFSCSASHGVGVNDDLESDSSESQDQHLRLGTNSGLRYAQTSPEFPMKRLLSNGSGAIFQICKVFRKEEKGCLHNPEFSMLEWYRPEMRYHQLMDEIEALLKTLGISSATERISYAELFQSHLKMDVLNATIGDLQQCAKDNGLDVVGFDDDYDAWASMLLANLIEPSLGHDNPIFVYDYPSSQAALARIRERDNVAERFELYISGVEIANGYQELTDANIYRKRFDLDNKKRKLLGKPEIKIDNRLIDDLLSGFPDSSGVALGLDRLLMVMAGVKNIDDVLSFHFENS